MNKKYLGENEVIAILMDGGYVKMYTDNRTAAVHDFGGEFVGCGDFESAEKIAKMEWVDHTCNPEINQITVFRKRLPKVMVVDDLKEEIKNEFGVDDRYGYMVMAVLNFVKYTLGYETIPTELANQIGEWCDARLDERMDESINEVNDMTREYLAEMDE